MAHESGEQARESNPTYSIRRLRRCNPAPCTLLQEFASLTSRSVEDLYPSSVAILIATSGEMPPLRSTARPSSVTRRRRSSQLAGGA